MSAIRIVTDSTSDIPHGLRQELGIEMVPLKVHFGDETYLDSITIDSDTFYRKLSEAPALPTTSQPSPMDFLEVYRRLAAEPGTQIISIHLSSTFSGTYQSANLAKSMMEEEGDITLVDSLSATYGIGLLVVAAARAAREGQSKEEILSMIERLRSETSLYFLVDTLEYLHKGGRIGKASAVFGALLNIKPILSIDSEGEVASVDKVRGSKRAVARIIELLKERHSGPVRVTIAHAACLQQAEELGAMLGEHFDVTEHLITTIGPVIGAHVGNGTLGVFMVPA
ncbi:DegV family protein [Gorillibacterium sp. sgz5001074]|uniref:DegV family protein n=1 Tax=Gorillibacterium sp. sgz5001074 TaxID=3446695 RepID=UPI003F663DD0